MRVASEEFAKNGFVDANMPRIAGNAGVSKKTIYARYASKDDLLIAVVYSLARNALQAPVPAVANPEGTPRSVLTQLRLWRPQVVVRGAWPLRVCYSVGCARTQQRKEWG